MVCKASLTKSSRLSGSASNIPSIRINFLLLSFEQLRYDGAPLLLVELLLSKHSHFQDIRLHKLVENCVG